MPFLGVTHNVMHDTTRAVLDGLVEDQVDSDTYQEKSEVASRLNEAICSYAIKKFSFSEDTVQLERFSDLDCIAIHEAKQRFEQQTRQSSIVHLKDFIVDVANMLAYPRFSPKGLITFKVVRSDQYNLTRNRLSSRKDLDKIIANDSTSS